MRALSQKQRGAVPWGLVRDSLGNAVRSRWLETIGGAGPATEFEHAGSWVLRTPGERTGRAAPRPAPNAASVELAAHQVQDLAESIPQLLAASAGHDLRFRLGVVLAADAPEAVRREVDELLVQAAPDLKSDTRDGAPA